MVNVALPGRGLGRSGTLTLPVEQRFIDRVVIVHRRGRVIFVRLVQRHKKHVRLLLREILHAETLQRPVVEILHRRRNLAQRIMAVQFERMHIAEVNRLRHQIHPVETILQQGKEFLPHHRRCHQPLQVLLDIRRAQVLGRFVPHRLIKHLQHQLLRLREPGHVQLVHPRQIIEQKTNPSRCVNLAEPRQRPRQLRFDLFLKIGPDSRQNAKPGKTAPFKNLADIQMIILGKMRQRHRQPAFFLKRLQSGHQPGPHAKRTADIFQNVLLRFSLQLDKTALRYRHKAFPDFVLQAASRIG